MEPASALSQRGHVPWQGFLLSVSLLTLWSPPTASQLALELMPSSNTTEGTDVLFLVYNQTDDFIGYSWFKGQTLDRKRQIVSYNLGTQSNATGPAYSGRETIYPNGSLLFQNVTLEDTGYYTLQALNANFQAEIVIGQLHVYPELPKPTVTTNTSDPMEHKDPVVLTCEPEIQDVTYLWLINSQSVQNSTRLELSKDNRTLTLLNFTMNDAGPYECEIRNPVSASRSDPFYLKVVSSTDAPTQGSSGLSAGAIAGIVIGVLAAIALIAALVYFLYIRKTGGASDQRDLTDHKPSASNHSQGHSDNSPNKIDEVAYSSLNFSVQESKKPTSASPSSPTTETVYSEVKKK